MTSTPKLNAAQARQLHEAEVAVAKLKAQLEIAETTRDELRDRFIPRLSLATEAKEKLKGVLVGLAGGISVRATPCVGAEYFRLRDYRAAGHQVTPEMAEHISPGKPYLRWTVKTIDGPKHHDAVEPAR